MKPIEWAGSWLSECPNNGTERAFPFYLCDDLAEYSRYGSLVHLTGRSEPHSYGPSEDVTHRLLNVEDCIVVLGCDKAR